MCLIINSNESIVDRELIETWILMSCWWHNYNAWQWNEAIFAACYSGVLCYERSSSTVIAIYAAIIIKPLRKHRRINFLSIIANNQANIHK